MASPYECFQVGVDDGIAHLQLSRPEKTNSLTQAFWSELPQVFASSKEFHATNAVEREAMQGGMEKMQDALNALERTLH